MQMSGHFVMTCRVETEPFDKGNCVVEAFEQMCDRLITRVLRFSNQSFP